MHTKAAAEPSDGGAGGYTNQGLKDTTMNWKWKQKKSAKGGKLIKKEKNNPLQ